MVAIDLDTQDPKTLAKNLILLREDRATLIEEGLINLLVLDATKREIIRRYIRGINELIEVTKSRLKSAESRAASE